MNTSVAIVNWNSGKALAACVESILALYPHMEISIVDNGSQDHSITEALRHGDGIRITFQQSNTGFAAGVNRAVGSLQTPYVLILNPDVLVRKGAIEAMETVLNQKPRVGAVGGYVNDNYLPRKLPTALDLIRQNLGLGGRGVIPRKRGEPYAVEQPAAAAIMVRRAAFQSIGGFDEQFFPAWYEDVDFCRRLIEAGWDIYFAPEAEFLHEGGYSAKAMGRRAFIEAYYHNQWRYAYKHCFRLDAYAVRASKIGRAHV